MNKEEEVLRLTAEKAQLSQQAKEAYTGYQLALKKARLAEEAYLNLKRTFAKVDSRLFSLTKGATLLPFHGPKQHAPKAVKVTDIRELISKFSTADRSRLLALLSIKEEEKNVGINQEVNQVG